MDNILHAFDQGLIGIWGNLFRHFGKIIEILGILRQMFFWQVVLFQTNLDNFTLAQISEGTLVIGYCYTYAFLKSELKHFLK